MSYASRIKEKRLGKSGKALIARFPSHGQVSIVGSIEGGRRLAGDEMLADAHAAMLLEGTKKRTKSAIQIALDDIGASLAFEVERDRLTFTGHVRDIYLKKLLALICEALCEPSFPKQELAHFKERTAAELSLESQDTRTQAGINLSQLLYAEDHPNYQTSTVVSQAALATLSRADLVKYHARAVDGWSLVVSVSGDMESGELLSMLERSFSKLPRTELQLPAFSPARPRKAQKASASIAEKASIDYMLGVATGITKDSPEYPALLLGLQILGNRSGFTGRLMRTVREVEGLTYGVYAYPAGFLNADGYATVWATFAPELFEKGKAALMREIRKIVEEGADEDEVEKHQKMFDARSRVMISNSESLARAAHDIAVEGRAPSYLDEFPERVLKLTRAEVNAALKKYLVVEDLSESSAGPVA